MKRTGLQILLLLDLVLSLSGCVSYGLVQNPGDAKLDDGSAIVVVRLITADNMVTKPKPGSGGLLESKAHLDERLSSQYRLRDTGNMNSIGILEIKNSLHAVRISGGLDKPFTLQYQQPEIATSSLWMGKVSPKVAFKLPKGGSVYYLGQINLDEKGTLRVSTDLQRDSDELYQRHPYLKSYSIVPVKARLFQKDAKDFQIQRAFESR